MTTHLVGLLWLLGTIVIAGAIGGVVGYVIWVTLWKR